MTFIPDPKHGGRVFDPESGHALTRIVRDVPKGEAWFDFLFDGTSFDVKANVTWSNNPYGYTYSCRVKQLEDSFRLLRREPTHQPSPEQFRATVLPALRDAIVAHCIRISGDPRIVRERLKIDVNFVDRSA